jgi:hypothetical protein
LFKLDRVSSKEHLFLMDIRSFAYWFNHFVKYMFYQFWTLGFTKVSTCIFSHLWEFDKESKISEKSLRIYFLTLNLDWFIIKFWGIGYWLSPFALSQFKGDSVKSWLTFYWNIFYRNRRA